MEDNENLDNDIIFIDSSNKKVNLKSDDVIEIVNPTVDTIDFKI